MNASQHSLDVSSVSNSLIDEYRIVRATYSHVCDDYRLYTNDDEEIVWFSPSRPHKINLDIVKLLLHCYVLDECHLTSLSDVHIYVKGSSGETIPHPDFPDQDYPKSGHIIRGAIEMTIVNYMTAIGPKS